jgi:predicted DNA-binding transcriptional regulator AlpA
MSKDMSWLVTLEVEAPDGARRIDPYDKRVQRFSDWLRSAYQGSVAFGENGWSATVRVQPEAPVYEDWQAAEAGRRYVMDALGTMQLPQWPIVRISAGREDFVGLQPPQLLGIREAAQLVGISRQRLHSLRGEGRFPDPFIELSTGPIWRKSDVEDFALGWNQRPGRRTDDPKRFFVQHLDMSVPPHGANYTGSFHTLTEAQTACDRVWSTESDGVRQEIADTESHEQWLRANGRSDWQRHVIANG